MKLINKTSNYKMYENNLETQEKFIIAISNFINFNIEINVKLNNNLAVIEPNKCYISITNTNLNHINISTIKDIIMKSWNDLQQEGYRGFASDIRFIVDTDEELEIANKVANESGLRVIIEKSSKYQQKEKEQDLIEKFLKANTITKIDNGIMKTYTERKADKFNVGYMLEGISKEEMFRKLQELKQDPNQKELYNNMTEEELANAVLDAIAREGNRKKYYLESAKEQIATNKMEAVAGMVATQNEGTVNREIGVIKNDASRENKMNTVEQVGNQVNVVTPEVNTAIVSTNNAPTYSFNHSSTNAYYGANDYNSNTNQDGYGQSQDNPDENITEEETQKRSVNKENVYVKKSVLTEEQKQSSGIISLPIIIFIISGFLLIASAIIFFISK